MHANLIFLPVQFHSSCMSKNQVMGYHVGFGTGVTERAVSGKVRATAWSESTAIVAIVAKRVWLIKCAPVLHSIAKCFEAKFRIAKVIIPNTLILPVN